MEGCNQTALVAQERSDIGDAMVAITPKPDQEGTNVHFSFQLNRATCSGAGLATEAKPKNCPVRRGLRRGT